MTNPAQTPVETEVRTPKSTKCIPRSNQINWLARAPNIDSLTLSSAMIQGSTFCSQLCLASHQRMTPPVTSKMMPNKMTNPQISERLRLRRSRSSHESFSLERERERCQQEGFLDIIDNNRVAYLTGDVESRSLLASSSRWTAVEKRFQKYGSRTSAIVGRG